MTDLDRELVEWAKAVLRCYDRDNVPELRFERRMGSGVKVHMANNLAAAGKALVKRAAAVQQKGDRLYDVRASVYELDGTGADGAYDLILHGASARKIANRLNEVLAGDWGLSNSAGPCRLEINIGPAGRGDDLPL